MDQNDLSKTKDFSKIIIIGLIIAGFISTFICGYFLNQLIISTNIRLQPPTFPRPTKAPPQPTPIISGETQDTTKFLPGKYYFEDTIIAVTKDKPSLTIAASVVRIEQDSNFTQYSRMSYFDGKSWNRQSDTKTTPNSAIVSDNLVKSWSTTIDPSRVLKETVRGEFTIGDKPKVGFSTGILENEIGVRSLPGYTKFISSAPGTLTVDGLDYPAYIAYTRIYSLNAKEIQFYNQPFGLTTDYVVFWDTQGNFYHIDATQVDKPTPIYQTHQLGVVKDTNSTVTKTFSISTIRDTVNPPLHYTYYMGTPVNALLKVNRINQLNKAPNGSYSWYIGNIEGSVQKSDGDSVNGIGIIEYIHN